MINIDFHGDCQVMSAQELLKDIVDADQLAKISSNSSISGAAPLRDASASQLSFLDNPKYLSQLAETKAGLVIVAERHLDRVPANVAAVHVKDVYASFAKAVARLYPRQFHRSYSAGKGVAAGAFVDPTAKLEFNVEIAHGAFVGADSQIGEGTFVGQNSVIGRHVTIGRNCYIMPGATIECAHIGDNVVVHGGARIGQDGFGFAMSPQGHSRVLQLGSVIIQDDVDVGANSTVDRGTLRDTIIGQGCKIDNQVQIAHNVQLGSHCVLAGQVGIAGSTTLGDFVVLGGKVGVAGHITVDTGTQAAAGSMIAKSTEPGMVIGGAPAKDVKTWRREVAAIALLGKKSTRK